MHDDIIDMIATTLTLAVTPTSRAAYATTAIPTAYATSYAPLTQLLRQQELPINMDHTGSHCLCSCLQGPFLHSSYA